MEQSTNPEGKKRILVVAQHFWPENFRINDIVEGFMERGVEVDVLCGLPNYPLGEWFDGYSYRGPRHENYKGAEVFRAGEIRRWKNHNLFVFLNFVSFPFFALFSIPRLSGRKYDAVFCFETSPVYMIFPAIVAAKVKRAPLTAYVLDLWPENLYPYLDVKGRFWRWLLQKTSDWHYRHCDRLIAMSDSLAARLRVVGAGKKHPADVYMVPQYSEDFYAVDIDDAVLRAKYCDGSFNIVFAGNISPLQDMGNLVRAMKIVREKGGKDVRCLIVGDGMSRQKLEDEVKAAGLQDAIVFCGSVPARDVPRYTTLADALFAGLTADEGIGMTVPGKIASYLAAGRPMLVAADDEPRRAADASGASLTSPAGDAEALAENILKLRAMPEAQRKQLGENGRAHYRAHYRRDVLLGRLLDVTLCAAGGEARGRTGAE